MQSQNKNRSPSMVPNISTKMKNVCYIAVAYSHVIVFHPNNSTKQQKVKKTLFHLGRFSPFFDVALFVPSNACYQKMNTHTPCA